MARKNKPIKTKYACIYALEMANGTTNYIARFSINSKKQPEINLSKKYPDVNTALQAFNKLNELKVELAKGNDVLGRGANKVTDLIEKYLNESFISKEYRKNGLAIYNRHMKPVIGHLYINKVTKEHIEKILTKMRKDRYSPNYTRKVRVLLNPVFKEAFETEVTRRNILAQIRFDKQTPKPELSNRIAEPLIEAIRKIYNKALEQPDSYGAFFLTSIMTGRRIGEICEVKLDDIQDGWVIVRAITTKTMKNVASHPDTEVERYPLPKEVLDRLDFNREPTKKAFKHYIRTYQDKYALMINECDLKLKALANDYPIRNHDNRNFIMSILGRKYGRDRIGSICLSHKDRTSNINARYDSIELSEVEKIYNEYWAILRGEQTI